MSERRVMAGSVAIGDLRVGRMAYGAMRITGRGVWGEPRDRGEARRVLRRVVELGVDLIDTADSYGPAVSEELIAQALHPYPEHLVIATKGGSLRPGPGQWVRDGRPEHLKKVCEESLARLRLEQIPLYQLHSPDPNVPIEDSIGALRELQQEGKIKHIGVSNVTVDELERAQAVAPIVSVQNRYNALDRHSDALVERCETARTGLPAVGAIGEGRCGCAGGTGHRRPSRRLSASGPPGVAAGSFAGDCSHPRERIHGSRPGEHRGRGPGAHGRRTHSSGPTGLSASMAAARRAGSSVPIETLRPPARPRRTA